MMSPQAWHVLIDQVVGAEGVHGELGDTGDDMAIVPPPAFGLITLVACGLPRSEVAGSYILGVSTLMSEIVFSFSTKQNTMIQMCCTL